jgi:hypothetical protein
MGPQKFASPPRQTQTAFSCLQILRANNKGIQKKQRAMKSHAVTHGLQASAIIYSAVASARMGRTAVKPLGAL